MLHGPVVHGVGRQDNGPVPIDADDGDEEDASKEANEEEGGSEFAHRVVEAMFPYQIVNPERQGGYKEQIRQGQVQEVDVGDTLGFPAVGEGKHHQQISHHAEDKDKGIYRRQKGGPEGHDVPHVTNFRARIILEVFQN